MTLKKQVQVKVDGNKVKGTIVNSAFHSEYLILPTSTTKAHYSIYDVEQSIEELQELLDLMRSIDTAEILERSK